MARKTIVTPVRGQTMEDLQAALRQVAGDDGEVVYNGAGFRVTQEVADAYLEVAPKPTRRRRSAIRRVGSGGQNVEQREGAGGATASVAEAEVRESRRRRRSASKDDGDGDGGSGSEAGAEAGGE